MAKKLGDKLNEPLYEHGLSVAKLVERDVGVRANTIHRWMKGERAPRLEQLEGVARYFGVSAIYLADDSIERPEDVGGASRCPSGSKTCWRSPAGSASRTRRGSCGRSRRSQRFIPGGDHGQEVGGQAERTAV